ncbi:MAG: gamma-glutamyltransferase family protein [bacterium]|nr:gamma-glutamyltransferase family protein [bacterium]
MTGRGMIVCPQPVAAEAGRDVLRSGGNAVDAAVTTAFVQGVVDPHMCGLGGCGVLAYYSAREGAVRVLEFYATAGSKVRPDQWEHLFIREAADRYGYVLEGSVNDVGYQSVGVPGTVAGLDEALRRWGSIAWDQAVRPAVRHAREGFEVTGNVHSYWVQDSGPDEVPNPRRIQWTEESKRIYTRGGELFAVGDVVSNEDYARTLERLASHGARDFYEGEIAAAIADDFERGGGFVTREDLAAYRPRLADPVRGAYRGLDIVAAGPPAGGMTLLQMLNFLEGLRLSDCGWPSVEAALARVRAMDFAFADRERYLADPAFTEVPVAELIAKEYAAAARSAHDSPTTTHVTVVDGTGDAVLLTHTLGASSGVVTPGLGFTYNNYLNCFDPRPGGVNSLAPGKTRITMISPAFVFDGGSLRYALGAPGGTRIVTGVLQTLLNLVDHGMSPEEAVSAPRVDFQGVTVQAEQRVTAEIVDAVRAAGYDATRRALSYDGYFSRVQLIESRPDGALRGASDPRKDGGIALSA